MEQVLKSQVYYLNKSGSRWIVLEDGKKPKHPFKTVSGRIITRTVQYYESFGNFGSMCIYLQRQQNKSTC